MKSLHYCALAALLCSLTLLAEPIDRHALVARHEVVLKNFDANNPLSVGNGALLYATAMIAADWDLPSPGSSGATSGAPKKNAPGFLANGQWNVRWENLRGPP